ncbi:MAG: hypothetical protein RLZZ546_316 [Bacteroidota bacterium]|jgi:putative oxidoreductase
MSKNLSFLRIGLAVIFIMHSIPGMFNGGVNAFGNLYLNTIGFDPLGLPIAWAVKLSHVALVVALFTDKYLKLTSFITILILIAGIFMVHLKDGWYVVGGGRNGIEFNVLLILALLHILYPTILNKEKGT